MPFNYIQILSDYGSHTIDLHLLTFLKTYLMYKMSLIGMSSILQQSSLSVLTQNHFLGGKTVGSHTVIKSQNGHML